MQCYKLSVAFLLTVFYSSTPAEIISANHPGITYHQLGAAVENGGWAASSNLGSGFLTYGPYTNVYQDGVFKVAFKLSVDNASADDLVVALVDIYNSTTREEIVRREIHRKEFDAPKSFQTFDVSFVTSGPNNLEFRVFVLGNAYIAHESTTVVRLSSLLPGAPTPANALGGEHQVGVEGPDSSWISEPYEGDGFLTVMRMPSLMPGNFQARFTIRTGSRSSCRHSKSPCIAATLDVFNRATKEQLATIRLANQRFKTKMQTVDLPFSYDGVGDLEWRVHVNGSAHVEHYSSAITPSLPVTYKANDLKLSHQIGSSVGTAWATKTGTARGYLTYGASKANLAPGIATATFNLQSSGARMTNEEIAQLEVYDDNKAAFIAKRVIRGNDFKAESAPQDFDLVFEISQQTSLEFRVFATGKGLLRHNSTSVTPDRLSLGALWNQTANFEFRKRDYFVYEGSHDGDTSSLISLDGIWYAFNREDASAVSPAQADSCKKASRSPLQVVARSSSDRGITWSDPIVVARPNAVATSSEGCEIVDGGAFFDGETDVWHYLGQCIGVDRGWSLCHYTRNGSSPMGIFDADRSNPVVTGGELWSRICDGSEKSCPKDMTDEGTPQIIGKSAGFFYVTFHGAHYGTSVTGARGIARTSDFLHWQVSGGDLPGDAILSSRNCSGWRTKWDDAGCIGVGASRILRSAGRFYQLAEAADRSLLCQHDQKWLIGLFRNSKIGAAGTWESYAENPYIVNQNVSPMGCALQYMNLIRDRGEIFLEFSLYTPDYAYPNYIYQLVEGVGTSKVLVTR